MISPYALLPLSPINQAYTQIIIFEQNLQQNIRMKIKHLLSMRQKQIVFYLNGRKYLQKKQFRNGVKIIFLPT